MKKQCVIYLASFSYHLVVEKDIPKYQKLRCEVNYHALGFKPHIKKISNSFVTKFYVQDSFKMIHLRLEIDILAFAGCFDIFNTEEQAIVMKYRKGRIYRETTCIQ